MDEFLRKSFNPLFIGAAFLTKKAATPKKIGDKFQSPIHRGCFSDAAGDSAMG